MELLQKKIFPRIECYNKVVTTTTTTTQTIHLSINRLVNPTSQSDPATILGLPRTLVLGYTELSEGYRMQLADDV